MNDIDLIQIIAELQEKVATLAGKKKIMIAALVALVTLMITLAGKKLPVVR